MLRPQGSSDTLLDHPPLYEGRITAAVTATGGPAEIIPGISGLYDVAYPKLIFIKNLVNL